MKERLKDGHSRFRNLVVAALALVAVVAGSVMPTVAYAASSDLPTCSRKNYFNTYDAAHAICINPDLVDSTGEVTESVFPETTESTPASSKHWDDLCYYLAYHSYYGPDFDASLWPTVDWNGNPMTAESYTVAADNLIALSYSASDGLASYSLQGASDTFKTWIWQAASSSQMRDLSDRYLSEDTTGITREDFEAKGFRLVLCSNSDGEPAFISVREVGSVKLTISSSQSYTDDLDIFSLAGGEYTLYNMQDQKSYGTFTTDENGVAILSDIPVGTYWIHEKTPLEGYKNLDSYRSGNESTWYVEVSASEETECTAILDPIFIPTREHEDHEDLTIYSARFLGPEAFEMHDETPVEGTEFTVKYFDTTDFSVIYGTPKRTWVYKCDDNGYIYMITNNNWYYVSGDGFFYDDDGNRILPRGIYTFEKIGGWKTDSGTLFFLQSGPDPVSDPEVATPRVIAIDATLTNENGAKLASATTSCKLVDTLAYQGLVAGESYTVETELKHGDTTIKKSSESVTAKEDGTVELGLNIDSSKYGGSKLVAYAYLTHDGRRIAALESTTDADQTINVASLDATLKSTSGSSLASSATSCSLTNKLTYQGLIAGHSYTAKTTLKTSDGKTELATASKSFTPSVANGSVEAKLSFDSSEYAGQKLVATTSIYDDDGNLIGTTDEQSVRIFSFSGQIRNTDGGYYAMAEVGYPVTATYAYTGLIPGETYKLSSNIDCDPYPGSVANPLTTTFTASDDGTGTVVVNHSLGDYANEAAGAQLYIRWSIYDSDGNRIEYCGRYLESEMQLVNATSALATTDGSKYVEATTSCKLTNTVSYAGLNPIFMKLGSDGKPYTPENRYTAKSKLVTHDGETVIDEEETAFTAILGVDDENLANVGTVEIPFTFDSTKYDGQKLRTITSIYDADGDLVCTLDSADNPDQSIQIVSVSSTLTNANGTDSGTATNPLNLTNTVKYKGLTAGHSYTAKTTLKTSDGKTITETELSFEGKAEGTEALTLSFDATEYAGQKLVATTSIYDDDGNLVYTSESAYSIDEPEPTPEPDPVDPDEDGDEEEQEQEETAEQAEPEQSEGEQEETAEQAEPEQSEGEQEPEPTIIPQTGVGIAAVALVAGGCALAIAGICYATKSCNKKQSK